MPVFGATNQVATDPASRWSTATPIMHSVEQRSHHHAIGNTFGSYGDGVGEDPYLWPNTRPDNAEGLVDMFDASPMQNSLRNTDSRWFVGDMAVSEKVAIHDDPKLMDSMRRVVIARPFNTNFTLTPSYLATYLADDIMAYDESITEVELAPNACRCTALAFLDPSAVDTPLAVFYQEEIDSTSNPMPSTNLMMKVYRFPQASGDWFEASGDLPVTLVHTETLATDLAAIDLTAASTNIKRGMGGVRAFAAVNVAQNKVCVAYLQNGTYSDPPTDLEVVVVTLNDDGTVTSEALPSAWWKSSFLPYVRLDQFIASEDGQRFALTTSHSSSFISVIPSQAATNVFEWDGNGLVDLYGFGPSNRDRHRAAFVGPSNKLVLAVSNGNRQNASSIRLKVFDDQGDEEFENVLIGTEGAFGRVAVHGWQDGRLLVLKSDHVIVSGDYEVLTDGNALLYRLNNNELGLVDQSICETLRHANDDLDDGYTSGPDLAVPIGPDTVFMIAKSDDSYALFCGGITKGQWFSRLSEVDDDWVIVSSGEVGGGWPKPEGGDDGTFHQNGTHVTAVHLNRNGAPDRTTVQRHLLNQGWDNPGAAIRVDDTCFVMAVNGAIYGRDEAVGSELYKMRLVFLGLSEQLPILSVYDGLNPPAPDSSTYYVAEAAAMVDGGTALLACTVRQPGLDGTIFFHLRLSSDGQVQVLDQQIVDDIGSGLAGFNDEYIGRLLEVRRNVFAFCGAYGDGNRVCSVTVNADDTLTVSPVAGDSRWGDSGAADSEPMVLPDGRLVWFHAFFGSAIMVNPDETILPGTEIPPGLEVVFSPGWSTRWTYAIVVTVPGGLLAPTAEMYPLKHDIDLSDRPEDSSLGGTVFDAGWIQWFWDSSGGAVGDRRLAVIGLGHHPLADPYNGVLGEFEVDDDARCLRYINGTTTTMFFDVWGGASFPFTSRVVQGGKSIFFSTGWYIGASRGNAVGYNSDSLPSMCRVYPVIGQRGNAAISGRDIRLSRFEEINRMVVRAQAVATPVE